MKRMFWLIAMLCVLCGAKATLGADFEAKNLAQLEVGKTTLQQAIALLGTPPASSVVGRSGATGYRWQYIASKASMWTGQSSTESKQVVLVFGTDGRFQRILELQGIQLDMESHQRLLVEPAAHAAASR
ncbi:outer membrane protein assembly factor BamE domain-containing protein [Xanthomonas citri]|uniref:outer membrane protein assembly factor BamE domain-containing protein n=1 Tax=Xanthomonas citri TaxID=346 RepID=UPI0005B39E41|nr:outer membrane protein assembly factor BamE [Xanthomonas citri]AMV00313.1 hypothetical protein TP37_21145 [Xanthomonas citri pv. aurantifolii]AMV04629.1 hypothetical protein TP50_20940 [Xanthomonas citri pv. aurantifolii]MCC8491364.1 outer membrane protein assembly factor BamE [Xanthomonas citri pv. fuscans]TBW97629.1 hypothetical protein TP47_10780 [Xanthomonas citri pv. aurantifolii]TBW99035.1 hypothetical protein TP49_05645 [Xanthomonas citri pv. aurantifolii]